MSRDNQEKPSFVQYIAHDDQSLTAVDNSGFCGLLSGLEPRFEILSCHHITKTVLPNQPSLSSSRSRLWEYSGPYLNSFRMVTCGEDYICSSSVWELTWKVSSSDTLALEVISDMTVPQRNRRGPWHQNNKGTLAVAGKRCFTDINSTRSKGNCVCVCVT